MALCVRIRLACEVLNNASHRVASKYIMVDKMLLNKHNIRLATQIYRRGLERVVAKHIMFDNLVYYNTHCALFQQVVKYRHM